MTKWCVVGFGDAVSCVTVHIKLQFLLLDYYVTCSQPEEGFSIKCIGVHICHHDIICCRGLITSAASTQYLPGNELRLGIHSFW